MDIIKYNDFSVNESNSETIKLYRLTSHAILDLNDPGEFYVKSQNDIDPKMLDKKGKDLFVITVECPSSNIDLDKSDKESALHNIKVYVVKDSKKCEVIKVEPYK